MFSLFAQVTNIAGTNDVSTNSVRTNAGPAEVDSGQQADTAIEANGEVVSEPSAIADFFDSGAIGLLIDGGFFMWPILIMAIMALAVIIERWRSLKMLDTDNES